MVSYEMAERVAGYYCAVRALEDELTTEEYNNTEHPEWDVRESEITEEWALSEAEEELLSQVLEAGLCDYFSPEDVMSVL
jgi:hypothetical protein